MIYNRHGKTVVDSKYNFTWEVISPTIFDGEITYGSSAHPTWDDMSQSYLEPVTYSGNIIQGKIAAIDAEHPDNYPLVLRLTVSRVTNYNLIKVLGCDMVDNQNMVTHYIYGTPNRVEFKTDGTIPVLNNEPCFVKSTYNSAVTNIYPTWTIH